MIWVLCGGGGLQHSFAPVLASYLRAVQVKVFPYRFFVN